MTETTSVDTNFTLLAEQEIAAAKELTKKFLEL